MIIKSSTALRNDYGLISDLAHEEAEPIYITKNGEGDLVVMSIEAFEQREEALKLRAKLEAAETALAELGFRDFRVRVRQGLALVQVTPEQWSLAAARQKDSRIKGWVKFRKKGVRPDRQTMSAFHKWIGVNARKGNLYPSANQNIIRSHAFRFFKTICQQK